jgi:2,4'-dihydroxyacetophenone dioxygenase
MDLEPVHWRRHGGGMTTPTTATNDTIPDQAHIPWVPTRGGISFKPLRFLDGGRGFVELMRLEPGAAVPRHRHTGAVHAVNLQGQRRLAGGEIIGPGGYVYEPPGNVDSWSAVGDEPVIIHVVLDGAVEYLDDTGAVTHRIDARGLAELYQRHCREHGLPVLDLGAVA